MSETMRRWVMDGIGRETLKLDRTVVPVPAPGEVLVRTGAVSLNYRDKLVIETGMGLPLAFPFVPASDMAGTVAATGIGTTRFRPGDRVMSTFSPGWIDGANVGTARNPPYKTLGGAYPGVLSEFVCFPEDWFSAAPSTLDDGEASTLPCAGLTAWFALVEHGAIGAGQSVLVHGTGGVALFGVQIAAGLGASVIVVSGNAEKLGRAKALGASHGIDRSAGSWVEAVYALTGDRGIDHVLETVGGQHLGQSIQAAAVGGRISLIGVLDGFEVSGPAGHLLLKQLTIQGIAVGHRRGLEDFSAAVDRLALRPVIDRRYRLDELPAALDHLDRGPFGKVVIELG